jgi:hypothetical protein
MSLRFPPDLRKRVQKYATSRGLEEATAVRTLCADRLRELDLVDDIRAAEAWQLEQATENLDQLRRRELTLHEPEVAHRLLAAASENKPRSRRSRSSGRG